MEVPLDNAEGNEVENLNTDVKDVLGAADPSSIDILNKIYHKKTSPEGMDNLVAPSDDLVKMLKNISKEKSESLPSFDCDSPLKNELKVEEKETTTPTTTEPVVAGEKSSVVENVVPQVSEHVPAYTNPGDRILQGLQQATQVQQLDTIDKIENIQQRLVDRILVETNTLTSKESVKLIFTPQLLPETSVTISLNHKNLLVAFETSNMASQQFLMNGQPALNEFLTDRLKMFDGVDVKVNQSENGGSASSTPNEGRSRNRREYQAEKDD